MATTRADQPADTRMMGVVHSAMRRDLVRARLVLEAGAVAAPRRSALGAHLVWLMETLHHHHEGEDEGLYPLVRRENPAAGALLDAMDAEHDAIQPAMADLERAAAAYRDGADEHAEARGADLLAAVSALEAVLLPHLEREEREMMLVVAASLTEQQWLDWDIPTNVKSKKPVQLGLEGHWLLDGTDDEQRAKLLSQVPPVPRFLLLHGFRRAYVRRRDALWAGTPAAAVPSLSLERDPAWR